jgi:hypothetical protein
MNQFGSDPDLLLLVRIIIWKEVVIYRRFLYIIIKNGLKMDRLKENLTFKSLGPNLRPGGPRATQAGDAKPGKEMQAFLFILFPICHPIKRKKHDHS